MMGIEDKQRLFRISHILTTRRVSCHKEETTLVSSIRNRPVISCTKFILAGHLGVNRDLCLYAYLRAVVVRRSDMVIRS
jgi:hypothetical protein